jgi:hypothetical protein
MDIFTKNKLIIWAVIILAVLNLVLLSTLWFFKSPAPLPPPPPPKDKSGGVMMFLERELGLNEDQRDRFRQLRHKHFETTRKFRNNIDSLKREILKEAFKYTPDSNYVNTLISQIAAKEKEVENEIFTHFLNLKNACNDEQKIKFESLVNEYFKKNPPPEQKPHGKPDHLRKDDNRPPPPRNDDNRPPPPKDDRNPEMDSK